MKRELHTLYTLTDYGIRLIDLCDFEPRINVLEFCIGLLSRKQHRLMHREMIEHLEKIRATLPEEDYRRSCERLETSLQEDLMLGDYDDYIRSLFHVFQIKNGLQKWFGKRLSQRLCREKAKITAQIESTGAQSLYKDRLAELTRIFSLNEKECELLTFFFLMATAREVEEAFSDRHLKMDSVQRSLQHYCKFFGLHPNQLKELITRESTLLRAGILTRARHDNSLDISPYVSAFLAGFSNESLRGQFFEEVLPRPDLALEDFLVPAANTQALLTLLRPARGTNVLFHGVPGAGKTEFAKALAHALGLPVCFIKQADEDGDESLSHRKSALVAAQNMLQDTPCLLVVDECDAILNTQMSGMVYLDAKSKTDEKSWINHYTERNCLRIIWISNRTRGIDQSTKRRFSYTQEFRNPGVRQRAKAWQIQARLQAPKFINEEEIQNLARRYAVSPGIIQLAIQDVLKSTSLQHPEEQLRLLHNILAQQEKFSGTRQHQLAPLHNHYSLEGLNLDQDPKSVIRTLRGFYEQQTGILQEAPVRNLSLLLLGPPGTGKTEFAKYIAEQLDRELIVKRTSDIISPYLGESEQNIARAFQEAADQGAMLFFDEADSLFINRENAMRSWEVSQTNELLNQMENFPGVLICATNFEKTLDLAVIRRFSHKVRFQFLSAAGNLQFFDRILCPLLGRAITPEEQARVSTLPALTPGDFKVVHQRFVFEPHRDFESLLEALQTESGHRKARDRARIRTLNQG